MLDTPTGIPRCIAGFPGSCGISLQYVKSDSVAHTAVKIPTYEGVGRDVHTLLVLFCLPHLFPWTVPSGV